MTDVQRTEATEAPVEVFVVSPIGDVGSPTRVAADRVLRHVVRRALPLPTFRVERADEADNPGAITSRIVSSILEADLVVVDLSGHNPNVFYEAAIAHGFHKPTVHLQVVGEPLAFDLKDMSTIRYELTDPDSVADAAEALARAAAFALEHPDRVETPLTHAQRFLSVDASSDPTDRGLAEVIRRLDGIERRLLESTARQLRGDLHLADLDLQHRARGLELAVSRVESMRSATPDEMDAVALDLALRRLNDAVQAYQRAEARVRRLTAESVGTAPEGTSVVDYLGGRLMERARELLQPGGG